MFRYEFIIMPFSFLVQDVEHLMGWRSNYLQFEYSLIDGSQMLLVVNVKWDEIGLKERSLVK